jgi:hypothetical protein
VQVYLVGPDGRQTRLHGPGELAGKAGDVIVIGSPNPSELPTWAIQLGLAALRGANIVRSTPDDSNPHSD